MEAKINAMKLATEFEQLLGDDKHESESDIKKLISELQCNELS